MTLSCEGPIENAQCSRGDLRQCQRGKKQTALTFSTLHCSFQHCLDSRHCLLTRQCKVVLMSWYPGEKNTREKVASSCENSIQFGDCHPHTFVCTTWENRICFGKNNNFCLKEYKFYPIFFLNKNHARGTSLPKLWVSLSHEVGGDGGEGGWRGVSMG